MPTDWYMALFMCLGSMLCPREAVYYDEYMGLHGLWDHFGEASPFNGANHLTSLRLNCLIFSIGMAKYLC